MKNNSRRQRVVIVGCGRMGRNHCRVIAESSEFELVALVDPAVATQSSKESSPAPLYRALSDLSDESYDCAVVAVPTPLHAAVCLELIRRGKHVLVEKPLAPDVASCTQLLEESQKRGTILLVGHVERFNPAVIKLKEVITTKLLGDPIHFSFTRVGGFPSHREGVDNVLIDLAIHDLDVLQFLCGPFSLRASICHSSWKPEVLDTAEILVANTSGVSASIHVNWITPTKIRTIRVTGTKGVCFVDYMLKTCALWGGNLLSAMQDSNIEFQRLVQAYQNSDRVEFGVRREEPLKIQLEHFYRCLTNQTHECCSAVQGLYAVQMAQEAITRGG